MMLTPIGFKMEKTKVVGFVIEVLCKCVVIYPFFNVEAVDTIKC